TGRRLALDGHTSAGKTGTTNDNKDSWFVGYSYYYTTATWIGYDMPQTIPGTVLMAPIGMWKRFMDDIHQGLEPVGFTRAQYQRTQFQSTPSEEQEQEQQQEQLQEQQLEQQQEQLQGQQE
ncbi:MAG: glycosyl transferase, partial [Lachnospiraceae bacterium]|nr:glycosyl transferase [Lachnospiraceae bacterium]